MSYIENMEPTLREGHRITGKCDNDSVAGYRNRNIWQLMPLVNLAFLRLVDG